jgi:hypothetical protein
MVRARSSRLPGHPAGRARLLAAALACALGCGTTATIQRTDGPPVEAEIDSSDASTLRLRGPSGNVVAFGQSQVASIDHPGGALTATGAVVTAVGLAPTLWWVAQRPWDSRQGGHEGAILAITIPLILAGGLALWSGWSVSEHSKARARAFEVARPPAWQLAPAVPGPAEPLAPLPTPGGAVDDPQNPPPKSHFHR